MVHFKSMLLRRLKFRSSIQINKLFNLNKQVLLAQYNFNYEREFQLTYRITLHHWIMLTRNSFEILTMNFSIFFI